MHFQAQELYEAIKVTKENTVAPFSRFNEGIDPAATDVKSGGVIVFPTYIKAVNLSFNQVVSRIKRKLAALQSQIDATKRFDETTNNHNFIGYIVGQFLDGRYKAQNDTNFGEHSISVEIIGVDTDILMSFAEELCEDFAQKTVLLKDYATGKIYLIT